MSNNIAEIENIYTEPTDTLNFFAEGKLIWSGTPEQLAEKLQQSEWGKRGG